MYVGATLAQVQTALAATNAIFDDNIRFHNLHTDNKYIHCKLVVVCSEGAGSRTDRKSYAVCRHVLCVFVQVLPIYTVVYIKPNLCYRVNKELPYDYDGVHCTCSIQNHINRMMLDNA